MVKAPNRGDLIGKNPTGCGKFGVKRHVLTDGRGVPLLVEITGANVHDKWMVGEVLDRGVIRAPRGPHHPLNASLDKGYDYAEISAALAARRIRAHTRCRGEEACRCCRCEKARGWGVERTSSWHNRFRALLIRWESKGENYRALVHLAPGLIAFQQTQSGFQDQLLAGASSPGRRSAGPGSTGLHDLDRAGGGVDPEAHLTIEQP